IIQMVLRQTSRSRHLAPLVMLATICPFRRLRSMVDYISRQNGKTEVVIISSINLRNLTALAYDQAQMDYEIDLIQPVGGFNYIPKVGEYSTIEAIGAKWKLKDKVGYQNPNLPGKLETNSVRLVRPKGKFTFVDRDGDWGSRLNELEKLVEDLTKEP